MGGKNWVFGFGGLTRGNFRGGMGGAKNFLNKVGALLVFPRAGQNFTKNSPFAG